MKRSVSRQLVSLLVFILMLAASFWMIRFATNRYYRQIYPVHYESVIEDASRKYGVPAELVFAVVRTESSFRPGAESSIGAKGLMQLTDESFEWVRFRFGDNYPEHLGDDLFDPETNIICGTYMLSLLIDEFQSVDTALAAYHAGWGTVKKWLGDSGYSSDGVLLQYIPYGDTRGYVKKVLETAQIYKTLYQLSK